MNSATILYNDASWLAGEANCFASRFGSQILPCGSVVVAFMVLGEDNKIIEVVDSMYMTDEQASAFNAICEEARSALNAVAFPG